MSRASCVAALSFLVGTGLSACSGASPAAPADAADTPDASLPAAEILDVFFGLDDALPVTANVLCMGASGMDGMPVTLSRRVAVDRPDASAFRITTRSGATHVPRCATLLPALAPTKRHTILLIGDLGSDPGDPPVRLDLVGSIPLEGGGDASGLSSTHVTPLADGPSLLIGLRYSPAVLSGCPSPATLQTVQITWSGGITAVGGAELGDAERARMHVSVEEPGGTRELTPFALADLGDRDNYTQLCLDVAAPASSVRVEAGVAIDPRGDANPETTIAVVAAE